VCLTPDPTATGVLVSWRQHDRMSVQQVRGAEADAAVQATMNAAVACVLADLEFDVEQFGDTGVCIVTAPWR
jgi:SH3-like domain-containing protein